MAEINGTSAYALCTYFIAPFQLNKVVHTFYQSTIWRRKNVLVWHLFHMNDAIHLNLLCILMKSKIQLINRIIPSTYMNFSCSLQSKASPFKRPKKLERSWNCLKSTNCEKNECLLSRNTCLFLVLSLNRSVLLFKSAKHLKKYTKCLQLSTKEDDNWEKIYFNDEVL